MEPKPDKSTSYFKIFCLLFSSPENAFNMILDRDETLPQIIILGLYGLLVAITSILISESLNGLTIFKLVYKGLYGAAFGGISIWFLSHLINIVNHILKAESEFEDVYFVFSYSLIPVITILLFVLLISPLLNSSQLIYPISVLLILIGYIWTFRLLLIGNRIISKGNWIKNTVAVLIPILILIGLNIIQISIND